jgi:hypothetical protein
MALGAGFEAGPGPILLRLKHDREQPTNGVVHAARIGWEQLQPTLLVGPKAQACRADSVVEGLGDLR